MAAKVKFNLKYEMPLLLFGLAAMGASVKQLLTIGNDLAMFFATTIMFLGVMAAVLGLVKYWRYH